MADSFKIGNVIPRLFNGSKYETDTSRNSNLNITPTNGMYNPFKNSKMKVDVLTADVFDTANKNDVSFTGGGTTISKLRRMYSTFVGSISNFGTSIRRSIEEIGAVFGQIKEGFIGAWDYLSTTKVPTIADAGRAIKAKWTEAHYAKEVNMYAQKPISELGDMFKNELRLVTAA